VNFFKHSVEACCRSQHSCRLSTGNGCEPTQRKKYLGASHTEELDHEVRIPAIMFSFVVVLSHMWAAH